MSRAEQLGIRSQSFGFRVGGLGFRVEGLGVGIGGSRGDHRFEKRVTGSGWPPR